MLQCDQSDHVKRCEGYATAHKYNFDVLSEALGRAVISRAFVRNVDVEAYIGDLMPVFHLRIFSREANFSFVFGLSTETIWN
jgi:hypothetical protein